MARSLEEQILLLNESGGLPTFAGRNIDDLTDQEIHLAFIQQVRKIEEAKLALAKQQWRSWASDHNG